MIVFGDTHRQVSLRQLVDEVLRHLAASVTAPSRCDAGSDTGHLDRLRRLLIAAGCLEQAVTDAAEDGSGSSLHPGSVAAVRAVTDHAAALFCAAWIDTQQTTGEPIGEPRAAPISSVSRPPSFSVIAGRLASRLHDPSVSPSGQPLTVKTPEGFAFYSLYPEQYAAAALEWCRVHASSMDRCVLVVGLRSIGTALSAVVAQILWRYGWDVQRVTVRPSGPTDDRVVDLPDMTVDPDWAVLVDEGPGLSGSSLAGAADAVERLGVASSRISFMPGHRGEPGSMAGERVRLRWATVPRHVSGADELTWHGHRIPELLAAVTPGLTGATHAVEQTEDVGDGRWRRLVYAHPDEWPERCAPFERTKYRCSFADGSAVVWKFVGSNDEATFERQLSRARTGWCAAPLGIAHGFLATRWVDGAPPAGTDEGIAARLAQYVVDVAGRPQPAVEQAAAIARLADLLYWNTWESLGERQAQRTRPWATLAEQHSRTERCATNGDGHPGPAGWRRLPDGRLWKVDGVGHERDHTAIGLQSVAWDVAATLGEWNLCDAKRRVLIDIVGSIHPREIRSDVLRFHELAYAAFRVGQVAMTRQMIGDDPDEHARLRRAEHRYRSRLLSLLEA